MNKSEWLFAAMVWVDQGKFTPQNLVLNLQYFLPLEAVLSSL